MKTMKKFFAGLLVLCMVLAMPNMAALASTTGTEENPEVVTATSGTATQASDQEGYWYSYVATVTGYYAVDSIVSAGGYDTASYIINENTGVSSEYDKIFVNAGDTVTFKVCSMEYDYSSTEWPYPCYYREDSLEWTLAITEVAEIETLGAQTITVAADDTQYNYYYYTIPEDFEGIGIFSAEINAETTTAGVYYTMLIKNVNTDESDNGGNSQWGGFDGNASVKASAGQTIVIGIISFGDGGETVAYPELSVAMETSFVASGTEENPEVIDTMYNWGSYYYSDSVEVNGGNGYVYKYVAEMDGIFNLRFRYDDDYSTEEDESVVLAELAKPDAVITVTNDEGTKTYTYSTQAVEKTEYGETYKLLTLDVAMGDELTIHVKSGAEATEKVSLPWEVTITEPVGAESNPFAIASGTETVDITVAAGATYFLSAEFNFAGCDVVVSATDKNFVVQDVLGNQSVSENGEATLALVSSPNGIVFAIVNNEETEVTYTLTMVVPEGHIENPKEITFEEGQTETSVSNTFETTDKQYYFEYVATAPGYIEFTISSSVEGMWYYYIDSSDSEVGMVGPYYGNDGSEPVSTSGVMVSEGDVITVCTMAWDSTADYGYNNVAATVTLDITFVDAHSASVENAIDNIENYEPVEGEEESPVQITILDKDGNISGLIPQEVLEAAKENGVDIMFLVAEDVAWWVKADTLTDTLSDIDFSVVGDTAIPEDMITTIVGENDGYTISIAHDGDFGFTAVLGLNIGDVDDDYTGMYANLFYYNEETKGLEFVAAYEMEEANFAEFEMTHASDYVIVMSEEAMSAEDNIIPATGDFSSTMIYVIVLMGAALVTVGFVAKKRFA